MMTQDFSPSASALVVINGNAILFCHHLPLNPGLSAQASCKRR